jgi:hypothetical protein
VFPGEKKGYNCNSLVPSVGQFVPAYSIQSNYY